MPVPDPNTNTGAPDRSPEIEAGPVRRRMLVRCRIATEPALNFKGALARPSPLAGYVLNDNNNSQAKLSGVDEIRSNFCETLEPVIDPDARLVITLCLTDNRAVFTGAKPVAEMRGSRLVGLGVAEADPDVFYLKEAPHVASTRNYASSENNHLRLLDAAERNGEARREAKDIGSYTSPVVEPSYWATCL